MRRIVYNISEIEPYINWLYFYHAWGLSGKPREEKEKLKAEALDMLHSWEGEYHTYAVFGLFEANSEGMISGWKGRKSASRCSVSSIRRLRENPISVWLISSVLWTVE